MSAVETSAFAAPHYCCRCEEITAEPIQCPTHFKLWRGGRRLDSVGSIIRERFDGECRECKGWGFNHRPECVIGQKIENAKQRGIQVDRLFAAYVMGKLTKIPAGTRCDARDLFLKLKMWFDRQKFGMVETQIVLGDEDYGGVLDLRLDGVPYELKATYNIEVAHRLQAAAYSLLSEQLAKILHVTERYDEPRIVPLAPQDHTDWRILLDCHRMVRRRSK